MAPDPRQLYAVPFRAIDQARLEEFACGDELWSRHAAEWIRGSEVLDSMAKGTRVWLFETGDRAVVGFGSLGVSRWNWPPPSGSKTTVALIPMLGIATEFQGKPPDLEWRYSRQILGHLIAEAQVLSRASDDSTAAERPNWLALTVHRDNARAIRFYEQCDFELIPNVVRRMNHLVMKLWIGG